MSLAKSDTQMGRLCRGIMPQQLIASFGGMRSLMPQRPFPLASI